jgi:RNA polymerase I-specific transcription initiation factor RRN7
VERVFSGSEATELFLHCYQFILWKQCHWLVTVKGFPQELETVIRDLWNLRIRNLQHSLDEKNCYGSDMLGFSSTSEGEATETDGTEGISIVGRRSVRDRTKLPRLVETLALCYLGIVLMRLPTSLGEMYKWAEKDDLIFIRAVCEWFSRLRLFLSC